MSDKTPTVFHMSADFGEDDEGCWVARCDCGWEFTSCPSAETACDALMQHAREQGYLEAKRDG